MTTNMLNPHDYTKISVLDPTRGLSSIEPVFGKTSEAEKRRERIVWGMRRRKANFNRAAVWLLTLIFALLVLLGFCYIAWIANADTLTMAMLGVINYFIAELFKYKLEKFIETDPNRIDVYHKGKLVK